MTSPHWRSVMTKKRCHFLVWYMLIYQKATLWFPFQTHKCFKTRWKLQLLNFQVANAASNQNQKSSQTKKTHAAHLLGRLE